MELLSKLQDDMKTAMKAGEKDRLLVIRMLISEVKNIDLQPTKPTPEQAVESYAKKLRKSIEEYEKINQPEAAAKLKTELAIVDAYLPKKLDAAATENLIDAFLAGQTFTEKQIGQATGMFIKANGGNVDPAIVAPIVRAKLAGK
jgi:uncharacterized protein